MKPLTGFLVTALIAELSKLSSDLQRRASGLREQPALVQQSIEA